MAEIVNRNKALAVSPLKASQTMGGALAILGMARSMPLMHGSAGCTAFAKVFFVRHFREPVPLQTTAMDQVSSVMGADENIVEALKVICEKQNPAVVGLLTTALAETQGCDLHSALHEFRSKYPEYKDVAVIPVNPPDFAGSFESGFATTVKALIETLVPECRDKVGQRQPGPRALAAPAPPAAGHHARHPLHVRRRMRGDCRRPGPAARLGHADRGRRVAGPCAVAGRLAAGVHSGRRPRGSRARRQCPGRPAAAR